MANVEYFYKVIDGIFCDCKIVGDELIIKADVIDNENPFRFFVYHFPKDTDISDFHFYEEWDEEEMDTVLTLEPNQMIDGYYDD